VKRIVVTVKEAHGCRVHRPGDQFVFECDRGPCVRVQGYPGGSYHPAEAVSRTQMAVYISRALAGGDAGMPANPTTVSFPDDVPADHWAYRYPPFRDRLLVKGRICLTIADAERFEVVSIASPPVRIPHTGRLPGPQPSTGLISTSPLPCVSMV
jgi:hypothetical protein